MGDISGYPALAVEFEAKLSLQDLNTAPATPPNRNSTTTNNNNLNGVEGSENDNSKNNGVQRSPSFAFRAPQEAYRMEDFETDRVLGVGSYSRVIRATKKDTGRIYALKIMDKRFIAKEKKVAYVKLERIVLDQLDHPGIIRLYFTFQDTYHICIQGLS